MKESSSKLLKSFIEKEDGLQNCASRIAVIVEMPTILTMILCKNKELRDREFDRVISEGSFGGVYFINEIYQAILNDLVKNTDLLHIKEILINTSNAHDLAMCLLQLSTDINRTIIGVAISGDGLKDLHDYINDTHHEAIRFLTKLASMFAKIAQIESIKEDVLVA